LRRMLRGGEKIWDVEERNGRWESERGC